MLKSSHAFVLFFSATLLKKKLIMLPKDLLGSLLILMIVYFEVERLLPSRPPGCYFD